MGNRLYLPFRRYLFIRMVLAKALHLAQADEEIRDKAYSLIEHCDWMPALLTGNQKPELVKRSRCAAGHKGMWAEEWKGYPSPEFFSALDPLFDGFADTLNNTTYTSDTSGQTDQRVGRTTQIARRS